MLAKYRDNDLVKIISEKPEEIEVYCESGRMGTATFDVLKRRAAAQQAERAAGGLKKSRPRAPE